MIASGELNDASVRAITADSGPIVFVNRRVAGIVGSAVVDDAKGAAIATEHLIELGHRKLAHLGGPTGVDTASRRRDGFLEAASEAGLPATILEIAGYDAEGGRRAAAKVLERDPEVTGIVAANMNVGIGALRAIAEAGRRIPDDISVVAIHDHPFATFLAPSLTCVELPLDDLGAAAVDLLLSRVRGDAPRDIMVEGTIRLIQRESSAPPPGAER
jgi:LacI family transcriptional regulator